MSAPRKARNVLAKCPLCPWTKLYWYNGDKAEAETRAERGLSRHLGHKHKKVMQEIKRERRQYAKSQ